MTDKEKLDAIRAEILRLVDVRGYDREMANDLLAFMDSLPNEPAEIDFEQELYKAFGQVKDFTLGMRIAKWFYDMGKNSQEPVSEDFEAEWKEYFKYRGDIATVNIKDLAKHFANWQKERMLLNNDEYQTVPVATLDRLYASEKKLDQMMKDAIERTVKVDAGGYPYIDCDGIELYDYENDKPLAKKGQKAKVIIILED